MPLAVHFMLPRKGGLEIFTFQGKRGGGLSRETDIRNPRLGKACGKGGGA
jgi:hypothetical protein